MRLLAVTVLTNLDETDLADQGVAEDAHVLAVRRAQMARVCGFDGVISSGHEAAAIRSATGPGFLIVVPGIRPAGAAVGDQARVMTPAQAIAAGADYLVVGRPITGAANPAEAAQAIIDEIAGAAP
jgi:orotidine-5'-phosphate decarboxylase